MADAPFRPRSAPAGWSTTTGSCTTVRRCAASGSAARRSSDSVDVGVLRRFARGCSRSRRPRRRSSIRCRVLCCSIPPASSPGPPPGCSGVCGASRIRCCTSPRCTGGGSTPSSASIPADHGRSPIDRMQRPDGIVVASWTAAGVRSCRRPGPLDHRSVVHQLLDRRLVTVDELAAIGRRLCHPARRGSTTFRQTISTLLGQPHHDSHPELVLRAMRSLARGVPV